MCICEEAQRRQQISFFIHERNDNSQSGVAFLVVVKLNNDFLDENLFDASDFCGMYVYSCVSVNNEQRLTDKTSGEIMKTNLILIIIRMHQ